MITLYSTDTPLTWVVVLALASLLGLNGCASSNTPNLDAKFGQAVRNARQQQTLNPTAGTNNDPVLGIDAAAAVHTQGQYVDSFKSPPKSFEVLGTTGASSGGSSSGGGSQ
jgi:uncharacterized lipoprotein